jgi:predicted DNA-binding transcriptional regulator YafY
MRASRLLSLLLLLQLRGRLSAEALAAEFEVSVRTVYRDIDALSAAGVPVYAERGRNGGFMLRGGYQTRLTGLTTAEARALPLAGVGAAGTALGLGDETAAAQLKLLASLSPEAGADAAHVAARFHLDPVSWYSQAEDLQLLPPLAAAVWGDRRVRVDYSSWTQRRSRELDPLGLVLKGGLWYLVAASGGQPRSYRVGSIRALTTLEQRVRRPRGFDLARYWRESTRRFEAALLSRRARLRVTPAGLQLLRDTMPLALAAGEVWASETAADRSWREVTIAVEQDAAAARQLLRLGGEVEVLAPASLRRAVIAEARRTLAHYTRRRRSA